MVKKEQLLEEIMKHIHILETQDIKKKEEAQFFREFLKIYDINNAESYSAITNTSYLMCTLMAEDINISFSDLIKVIDDIRDFIDNAEIDDDLYKEYLKILKKLYDLGILDKVNNYRLIKQFNKEEAKVYENYKVLSKDLFTFEDDDGKIVYLSKANDKFVELFKILPEPDKYESFMDLGVSSLFIQTTTRDIYNGIVENIESSDYNINQRSVNKKLNKETSKISGYVINKFLEEEIGQRMKRVYDHFVSYSNALQKQVKDEVSSINKRIKKLDTFIYKLKYIDKKDVINIDNYAEFLFDSSIKELFIQFALEHNLSIYKKVEEKNKEYKDNKINKVEMLFNKYGFEFNSLLIEEQELIINESENKDIEGLLGTLKYSDLIFLTEYHKVFTRIILDADVEIVKAVDCALKNKIIDKSFIMSNIELLFDKNIYLNFTKNINLLTINEVDFTNIIKVNSQLLMVDNNILNLVFNILKEYNFKLNQDNNLEILVNSNLLDIIDNFIELEMDNIIKNSQKHLTEKSYNIVKRILISNLVGLNAINSSNKLIGQISTGNKFYIGPDKYDNYIIHEEERYLNTDCVNTLKNNNRLIISDDTKNNEVITKLDEYYRKDSLTYEIAGITISRNRVLRNFEVLKQYNMSITDILYQAVIYKIVANVDDEKLVEIYNSLKFLNLDKDKIYKR